MAERLAWAAGVLDARASLTGTDRVRVLVYARDRRVLDRLCEAVSAGKVYGPYESGGAIASSTRFSWIVDGKPAVALVLAKLWPWLGAAFREQAWERGYSQTVEHFT